MIRSLNYSQHSDMRQFFNEYAAEIEWKAIIAGMKSLLIIGFFIACSWHFTELESDQTVGSVLAPLVFIASLAWLAGWLAIKLMPTGRQTGDSSYVDVGEGGCGD